MTPQELNYEDIRVFIDNNKDNISKYPIIKNHAGYDLRKILIGCFLHEKGLITVKEEVKEECYWIPVSASSMILSLNNKDNHFLSHVVDIFRSLYGFQESDL
jgi:hypothetical protein